MFFRIGHHFWLGCRKASLIFRSLIVVYPRRLVARRRQSFTTKCVTCKLKLTDSRQSLKIQTSQKMMKFLVFSRFTRKRFPSHNFQWNCWWLNVTFLQVLFLTNQLNEKSSVRRELKSSSEREEELSSQIRIQVISNFYYYRNRLLNWKTYWCLSWACYITDKKN